MVEGTIENWSQVHDDALVFDLHAHPALKLSLFNRALTLDNRAGKGLDPLSVRTDFPKLLDGRVDVLNSVILAPERDMLKDCWLLKILKAVLPTADEVFADDYFPVTIKILEKIEQVVRKAVNPQTGKPYAMMIRSVKELRDHTGNNNEKQILFIHAVEGAHSLDSKIENLDTLFDRGVASMTLAHFYMNGVAPPVFPYPKSVQKFGCFKGRRDLTLGLTDFGKAVVERMVEKGMIIDVTHSTPPARKEIYDIVNDRAPILATHIGAYAINPNPYNLEDWELKRIRESEGAVGVIFMNSWLAPHDRKNGLPLIVQTIKHFTKVVGIDHVAIGSDFDGFTDPPDDMKDASKMPFLTQSLLDEGFDEGQVQKILGRNSLGVFLRGWKKRS